MRGLDSTPRGHRSLAVSRHKCCHCKHVPADGSLGEDMPFSNALFIHPHPDSRLEAAALGRSRGKRFPRGCTHRMCPQRAPCGRGLFCTPPCPGSPFTLLSAPHLLLSAANTLASPCATLYWLPCLLYSLPLSLSY